MKNINPWIITAGVSMAMLQVIAAQYFQISNLTTEIRFFQQSKDISNDLIDELMYTIQNIKNEKEFAGNQQFVAGVIEAINNKNYYSSIWHEGYNRGSAVTQYATEVRKEEESKKTADLQP